MVPYREQCDRTGGCGGSCGGVGGGGGGGGGGGDAISGTVRRNW